MAYAFTDVEVMRFLREEVAHPVYQFVEIKLAVPNSGGITDFCFTNFTAELSAKREVDPIIATGARVWYNQYLEGVSAPARSGEVTQEVQRFQFKQALDYAFSDADDDLLTALGFFHNAEVVCSAYVFVANDADPWKTDDPLYRTYGLVKSASRDLPTGDIVLETTSSFGKLQNIKEMRTTPASLNKYVGTSNTFDTSFDKAGTKHDREALEWGTG